MPLNGMAGQHQIFNSSDLNATPSGSRFIPSSPIEGTPAAAVENAANIPAFDEILEELFHKYLFQEGGLNRFVLTTEKRDAIKFWLYNPHAKLRGATRAGRLKDNNHRTESKKFCLQDNQVYRKAVLKKAGKSEKWLPAQYAVCTWDILPLIQQVHRAAAHEGNFLLSL
jgi:hypothetical protein